MDILIDSVYFAVVLAALGTLAKSTRRRVAKYFPALTSQALLDNERWRDATKYLGAAAVALAYLTSHMPK